MFQKWLWTVSACSENSSSTSRHVKSYLLVSNSSSIPPFCKFQSMNHHMRAKHILMQVHSPNFQQAWYSQVLCSMDSSTLFIKFSTSLKNGQSIKHMKVFIILQQKEEKVAISLHTHANEIQVVYFISRYESLEKRSS